MKVKESGIERKSGKDVERIAKKIFTIAAPKNTHFAKVGVFENLYAK